MLRWNTPSVSAAHSRKKTSREVEIEDGVLGAGAIREDGGLGGEVSVEMESLLSAKAHASPMLKDGADVAITFDDEEGADARRLHADTNDHVAASRKGHSTAGEPSRAAVLAAVILVFGFLFAVIYMLPPLMTVEEGDKFLWRPRSTRDFELDKRVLKRYRDEHAWQLLLGMAVVYIFLQTFCVPASGTSMNVLAGCIFSETTPSGEYLIAFPMCVLCVSVGAVLTYLISYISLREIVTRNFPTKVQWLRLKMADLRPMSMALFFVSLRVSPVVPAYILNVAAPVTPLPLLHFWLSTILGCSPHAIVTVTAGATLSRMRPGEDVLSNNIGQLVFLLVLSLCVASIPTLIKKFAPASMAAAQSAT